ncbi:low molecular weight phosphatase family protein [Microbacterium kyungheense]|uniref:Protein-tyrosine phosphatase n=1 Tax=Microbacterium kyungheense TaxID=1263636 RepID=A0A543FJT0_9MICO|nr:low molecular weight phosphatase family protein [Microbacterium kyungheense]TQM34101.1 protein-tyrosine phosphatase [Microbacterium kyungheense]
MFEILAVCTGNICRSPLAEQLLRLRLSDLRPRVASAGTRGLPAAQMTPEAAHIAVALGVPSSETLAHRSRWLTEQHLTSPDLILTMTRDHRRAVAELAPSRLRSTFTVREFARLAQAAPADELRAAASTAPDDSARVRAVAAVVASYRGLSPAPDDAADDDVIDPFGQPWSTYLTSAQQLTPAVDSIARTLRSALG